MTVAQFRNSVSLDVPPATLSEPLLALWYDAKGDWQRAHGLVDELETRNGMAVHAYLHRKEGNLSNAEYWYQRAGREHHRSDLADEWRALVEFLLTR